MPVARAAVSGKTGHSGGQAGFTILELMIAASVFAVILLIVAVGVINFTNSYYKGVTTSKTQETARSIMDTITQAIQFGQFVSVPQYYAVGTTYDMCVDGTLYAFRPGQEVTDTTPFGFNQGYHGLVAISNSCSQSAALPTAPTITNGRELLGQHMRINTLTVQQNGNLFTIHLRIIYGDNDLLVQPLPANVPAWESTDENCGGSNQAGEQFCAVADLTTTVEKRIL